MKYLIVPIVLIFISNACHQTELEALKQKMNEEKQRRIALQFQFDSIINSNAYYFQQAIQLEQKDPSKSTEILMRLAASDSTDIFQKLAQQRLAFNRGEKEKTAFLKKIVGKWHWQWSGTNWGTSAAPDKCNCTKTMILKEDMTFRYYEDRKLVRSGSFELKRKYRYFSGGPAKRLIKFNDNNTIHSINLKRNKSNTLSIAEAGNCICGCYEERYVRKKSRFLVDKE